MLKIRHYTIPLMLCPFLACAQGVLYSAKRLEMGPSPVRASVTRYVDIACDSTSGRIYIIVRGKVTEPCAQARQASLIKTVAVVGGAGVSAVAASYKFGQFQRNVTEVQVKEAMDIFFVPQHLADYSSAPVTRLLKKSVLRAIPPAAVVVGLFFGVESAASAAKMRGNAFGRGRYSTSEPSSNVGQSVSFGAFDTPASAQARR